MVVNNKRIVVYTCIIGKYDNLNEPLVISNNTDYVLFTDEIKYYKKRKSIWKVKKIPNKIAMLKDATLINRYIKMHPKELFKEYDYSLYIDGSIRVANDINNLYTKINSITGIAMHNHPNRDNVYEEGKRCIRTKKGNKNEIKELLKKYRKEKFPKDFGLFEATIILVDLKNNNSTILLNKWWDEFLDSNTYRDQLIFTHVLWKNGYKYSDVGILANTIKDNKNFIRYAHINQKISKNFKKIIIKTLMKTKYYSQIKNLYGKYIKSKIIKYRKIKYYGKKYKCNICNSWVREMKPDGHHHKIFEENEIIAAGYRDHVRCPVCYCKDKDRMVYYYIKKYTDILNGKNTVLHFAPETEIKRRILKNKKCKYIDGDIDKYNASISVDITNIQFDNNTFDYIICNHVLEHILDEKKAILELKRVIKPNGKIILTVPICISNEKTIEDNSITDPEERMNYFCQHDHVRLYGRVFKKRLEKYGLKVYEYNFEEKEGIKKSKKYGIVEKGCIYIASLK